MGERIDLSEVVVRSEETIVVKRKVGMTDDGQAKEQEAKK
jgi:hypothetical protein